MMESLANTIQLQKKRMGIYEVEEDKSYKKIVDDIHLGLKKLEENYKHTLSEQEKLTYKMMSLEELTKVVLDNQIDMKNNIDKLIERWI